MSAGLARVRPLARTHRGILARLVLSSLARSAAGAITILLTRDVLAGALGMPGGSLHVPLAVAVMLLGASILATSLFAFENRVTQQRVAQVVELDVMRQLLEHLLRLSVPFFEKQSPGDLLQAVRQDTTALRTLIFAIAGIALELTNAIGLFAAALSLSPRLTLWSLVVLPLATLPVVVSARRASAQSGSIRRTGYAVFDSLLELLRGARSVKIYRGDAEVLAVTMHKSRRYFEELIEMVRVQSSAKLVLELIAGAGMLIVVVLGGHEVMAGTLPWPSLLAFLVAIRALQGPVNNVNAHLISLGGLRASTDKIEELLSLQSTVPDRAGATPITDGPAEIAVDGLCFSYDDREVLHDLTFRVHAGETIGIVGPSGAGKSSLLALLGRFFEPTAGTIRFDDRDVRDITAESLHGRIGLVTQEPFLFGTTVRENIRAGRPAANDADVEAAARAVGLHDEILAFPDGYETRVGIGGNGVSGGQAQRIAIARALLRNPPLLLLDEATSSLDSESEQRVQASLDRLMEGRTAFVIAHRLSTLRAASRILVLDQGRLVGFGTHEALVTTCDLYRQLWQLQRLDARPS